LISLCLIVNFSLLFAEGQEPTVSISQNFELFHNVSVEKSYSFQFLNPSNNYAQYSGPAPLTLSDNQFFATLVLKFNANISFSRIELRFEPLHQDTPIDGEYDCAPYTMDVYKANERAETSILGSVDASSLKVSAAGESVAIIGRVNVISSSTTYNHQGTAPLETRRIADFVISVDGNEAKAGIYNANIYCFFDVEN